MYESPIDLYISDIYHQMLEQQEEKIYQAVVHFFPDVKRDELLMALQYDRGQYEKGYADGKRDAFEWISVSDHLPADHEEVLVCTVNRKIGKARWSEMWQKFTMSGQARVTHWMPLPKMPEVENE